MLVATRVIILPQLRKKLCEDGLAILPVEIWGMIVMYVGGTSLSFSTKKKIYGHGVNDKALFSGDKNKFLRDCVGI